MGLQSHDKQLNISPFIFTLPGVTYMQNDYVSYTDRIMGIVKISDLMHENLRIASTALSRSINAQAEHWMKIGMLAELYPDLNLQELTRLLMRVERDGGADLAQLLDQPTLTTQGIAQ